MTAASLALVMVVGLAAVLVGQRSALADGPKPEASLSVPGSVLIGSGFTASVTFDNADLVDVGYGPYLDVFLPVQGADGDPSADPVEDPDGISWTGSATYLGIPLTVMQIVLACDGTDVHPYTGPILACPDGVGEGDELLVIELPFGSFTPGQPPATVEFGLELSELADLGEQLEIIAQAGFRFGDVATGSDPIVQEPPVVAPVEPTLALLTKRYSGPEDETATGPNFPRTWTLELTVAPDQPLTAVVLRDLLPDNVAFLEARTGVAAGTVTDAPPVGVATVDGEVVATFDEVVGTGGVSATLEVDFFVPELDATGEPVIDPVTGAPVISENRGSVTATWDPIDERDGTDIAVEIEPSDPLHELTDRSLAIQKSVAVLGGGEVRPGAVLEWTLDFQVSDFFTFEALLIEDVLTDGQSIDASFAPRLSLDDPEGSALDVDVSGHVAEDVDDACDADGRIEYDLDLSAAVAAAVPATDGRLTGGLVDAPDSGPTQGTFTFRTVIDARYRCLDDGQAVDSRDVIANTVTISGDVIGTEGAPTGSRVTDGSAASVLVVSPSLVKSVYARNGDVDDPELDATPARFAAGDTVTYRLRTTLPITNFEGLQLIDFLPLPTLLATDITTETVTGPASAVPPVAGQVSFGPDHTGDPLPVPTVTTDAVANSITFDFGDLQSEPGEQSAIVDLLFTVTLTDEPFADGLFLTNQARLIYNDSFESDAVIDEIIQIKLTNPEPAIHKGVVATDGVGVLAPLSPGPGQPWDLDTTATPTAVTFDPDVTSAGLDSTPLGSDLTGVWAGDLVGFAIVVENTGSGINGAFDVTVTDTIPTGLNIPADGTGLQVTDGRGEPLGFTGDLFDPDDPLVLDNGWDGAGTGALAPFDDDSGRNLAVITYVLEVDEDVDLGAAFTNTASVELTAAAGGDPYPPVTSQSTVEVALPELSKELIGTLAPHTSSPDAAIGELATYEVTVDVPPSSTDDVVLRDRLDEGLAFVSFDSLSATPGLVASGGITLPALSFDGTDVSVTVTDAGRQVDITLGTLTNETDAVQRLTFTSTVVVLNLTANQAGTTRANRVELRADGSRLGDTARAQTLRVVEPALTVSKSVSDPQADAGDIVTYTIVVNHPDGTARAEAFDVVLTDVVPAGLTYQPGTFTFDAGTAPDVTTATAPTLAASWTSFAVDATATFTFDAVVDAGASGEGPVIDNTATLTWTSLPGQDAGSASSYNVLGVERTGDPGDPGGAANTYRADSVVGLDVVPSSITKTLTGSSAPHTDDPALTIGEVATFRLSVTLPEGELGTVTVTDVLPSGLAYVGQTVSVDHTGFVGTLPAASVNLDPGGGTSGEDLVITFADVTADSTAGTADTTFTITYDVVVLDIAPNVSGVERTNRAVVTVAGADSDPSTVTVNLVEPAVTIDKSFDPEQAAANDPVTIILEVTNTGTSAAFDLEVSDLLDPDVFTNVTVTLVEDGWASQTAVTTVTFTSDGPLDVAGSARFEITADLVDDLHEENDVPGTHTNTAEVSWQSLPGDVAEQRSYVADDEADLDLIVPDLRTVKTGPASVAPGGRFTYTITVTNDGDRAASDIEVVDTLPVSPLLSYVSSDPGGVLAPAEGDPATITWQLATLAAGATATFEVTLEVDDPVPFGSAGTVFVNSADAQHDGSNGPDPTPENNDDTHQVELSSTIDVTVAKSADPAEVGTDAVITYTLTVTNLGDEDAAGIVLTDTLPDHVSFVSASDDGTHDDGVVTWPAFSLAAGPDDDNPSRVVTVTVRTDATVPAGVDTLTSTAAVAAPGDGNDTNDTATADVDLDAAPVLTITKTDDTAGGLANPGEPLVYTLTVTNVGDQGATGVVVTDTLPDGVSFVSASDGGTHDDGVVTWTLPGELPAGDDVELTLTVTVDAPLAEGADTLTNRAEGTDDGENSDAPTTDDVELETPTNTAAIAKSLETTSAAHTAGSQLAVGEVATYQLTIELPEAALGEVVVTDRIPAGMAYLDGSLVVDADGFDGTLGTPTVGLDGQPLSDGAALVVTFADVVVDDTGAPSQQLRLRYDVVLLDAPANTAGTPRTNDATLTVAGATLTSNEVVVSVVEPVVGITKTFGFPDAAPGDAPGAAAGDTVRITLVVTNTVGIDAFEVAVTDLLDPNVFASAAVVSSPDGWAPLVTPTVDGPRFTASGPELAAGGTVTFTLDAVVAAGVVDGGSHTNTAEVTWDSLPEGTAGADQARSYGPATDDDTLGFIVPDLRVVKQRVGSEVVEPGDLVTFSITVDNDGGREAAGVVVTDTLPDHVSFESASDGGAPVGGTVVWPAFDLAAGTSVTRELVVRIDDPVPAETLLLTNTAVAADDGTRGDDPTPENNTDTAVVPLGAFVDVAVAKTPDIATTGTRGQITYLIILTNLGNEGVTGVSVTDTLPEHTSFVSATSGGTHDAGVVTWSGLALDGLGAANSLSLAVTVQVDASVPAGVGSLTNTVQVTAPGDIDPSNDTAEATVALQAGPDLVLVKSASVEEAATGDTVQYTLSVTNVGDQGATGVVVTDRLPDGVSFVSASAGGSHDDGVITWALPGELPAGAQVTVSATVTVDAPLPVGATTLVNDASVTDDGTNGDDPTPSNNLDSAEVVIGADLSVTKEAAGPLEPGGTGTYLITVTNAGPQPLTAISLVDTLGPGLSAARFTPSVGSYDPQTGVWDGLDLTVDSSVTIEVEVDVAANVTGTVTNEVEVAPNGASDPDPENNSASTTDPVVVQVDLELDKSHDGDFTVGERGTFTLTVTNRGPAADPGPITVVDELPAGLEPVAAGGAGWSCELDGQTVTCLLDAGLDVGASASLTVEVLALPQAAPGVVNEATVSSEVDDLDASNDQASDPVTVEPVSGFLAAKEAVAVDGTQVTWEITVTNVGTNPTTDPIVVVDELIDELTFVSASGDGWDCQVDGQTVTCTHPGSLEVDGDASFLLVTEMDAAPGATITNTARIPGTSGNGEDDLAVGGATFEVPERTSPEPPPEVDAGDGVAGGGEQASRPVGTLPWTGIAVLGLLGLGLGLTGSGSLLLRRRRRPAAAREPWMP